MNISEVIDWKFNGQSGMSTREGVITEFPGGIPTQAEQDQWTAEYVAYRAANPQKEELSVDDLYTILVTKGVLANSDRPDRPNKP